MKKELLDIVNSAVKNDSFSGAILVIKDEIPLIELATGFSNREKQIHNTLTTKFNIGSIDKTFTGVAIAQLVEKNKISFHDTIGKYLKDCPSGIANSMTIHHILTHTEGFSSYFNKKYRAKRLDIKQVNDYLEFFLHEPLLFEPGSRYQYSNSGYVVLGAIIESVTDQAYYEYINDHIFKIADMKHTSAQINFNDPTYAHGYTHRKVFSHETDLMKPLRDNKDELPPISSPAGGSFSTCYDLYNFSKALLTNKLLSPSMTKEILTPKIEIGTKNGDTLYYGYGFQILHSNNHIRYGHAGVMAGANARLDMYPDLGYTVVALSNFDEPSAFQVANKIGKYILFT